MCKSTYYRSTKDKAVFKALSTNAKTGKRAFCQRKVCFSLDKENAAPSPMKEITPEHVTDMWYSRKEIRSFQAEVKSVILSGLPSSEETYGMERYQAERTRQKKSIVSYVVLSQKVKKDPEFQSYISRRHTSSFKEMALNQALENFCEVYDPLGSLLDGGDNYNGYFSSDISFNMAMIGQSC